MANFELKYKLNPNKIKYHEQDVGIATEFAKKTYKELTSLVKAIVLFGSAARRKGEKSADIDMLIVIDDVRVELTPELLETYKIIVDKKILDTSKRLHIITLKFSTFWEYVRAGDPVVINILRDGLALVDTGFFDPLQALLYRGRIRPSQESINNYYARAPTTLNNANWHVLQAVIDLYWAVIDSAHAALMSLGFIPPSPKHVPDMLEDEMARKGKLEEKYVNTMRKFYKIMKQITHREIGYVSGAEYDAYRKEAEDFVKRMAKFVS
ncbi:nucleotidyltransferase domain-containing protein [Candidatus Woesearchaeota archaeon]|nr:nucleotidyltransferase domain-containing protein [Candidatus Woesearchaeota archaeon]